MVNGPMEILWPRVAKISEPIICASKRLSQVIELLGIVMFKQRCLTISVVLVMLLLPLNNLFQSQESVELDDYKVSESNTLNGWPDVPTWRIGDKYTYETQFDVQKLILEAGVDATLNALTGDTTYEVTDIFFEDIDNVQTLCYKMSISGEFSSNTADDDAGATLEGNSGRLLIYYDGEDIIRARDLAVVTSNFTLNVDFWPVIPFLGLSPWLNQDLADITFDTTYSPPKEKNDFPLRVGDQWYMEFFASTSVSGTSDYFDPSEFDTAGPENNSWQITDNGIPTQDGKNIQYSGCDDSYKINEWNVTGVSQGFNWYCPDVRYNSWMRVSNAAGFTIDWLLKKYEPAESQGVNPDSDPGDRNYEIDVEPESIAVCPNCLQNVSIDYSGASGVQPGINLQLRYEMTNTYLNPTTDASGMAEETFDTSNVVDTTNASDDYTSNGLIVWDPFNRAIGATTIILDPLITDVDLVAQADAIIVTRTRGDVDAILSKSIGFNALPGDELTFSIPTQNRGKQAAPSTTIEITMPNGDLISEVLPAIPAYSEARVEVSYQIPLDEPIGTQNLIIEVDPLLIVTEDINRDNNLANIEIFVGTTPTAQITVYDEVYTFENVTLDASASFDEDGGDVDCQFNIYYNKTQPDDYDSILSEDCIIEYNWSDDNVWNIQLTVIDEELDIDIIDLTATVLNRAPFFNLSLPEIIYVDSEILVEVADYGDIDTQRPANLKSVDFAWPGLDCGDRTVCTILAEQEGPMTITVVATDDDGASTTVTETIDVLNVIPTISEPELKKGGVNQVPDENGYWNLYEDETVLLKIIADDSSLDKDSLTVNWVLSDIDSNLSEATTGVISEVVVSWSESGLHNFTVVAYDDDGAQSEVKSGIVNISNVLPTIADLGSTQPILEDNNFTLKADVDDTPSDIDDLVVCWDLDSSADSDGDDIPDNDCELEGLEITTSWQTSGIRWITATVIDDDGATDSTSMNVSVINEAPKARISYSSDVLALNEGDNLTLSGLTTTDTANDKLGLSYVWDSDHLDNNLDGNTVGDTDFIGAEWTIADLPAGNWVITLTATDDDGESNTATIEISVKERPAEGFLEAISNSVGGGGTLVIGILVTVVIGLAAFLLLTRNPRSSSDKYSDFNIGNNTMNSQFSEPIKSENTGVGFYQQDTVQSDSYAAYNPAPQATQQAVDPYAAYNPAPQATQQAVDSYAEYNPTAQTVQQISNIAPTPQQGPPVPATGIPEGWTMEQWGHYGAQYLAAQSGYNTPIQPIITDTTTQSANSPLDDILDDLDL